MSKPGLNTLKPGQHYLAKDLDSFISSTDAVLLSSNDNQLFTEPEREYKVVHEFTGFFEHSMEDGEKYFREKKAYVVEKA
ncbi:hypothetical protein [Salipaludibacillus aurantiacus]|uniref:Uncharacterized protein n=1 Tax=Salipaludibacillus aurantiacus TaxID=1601833 RepID=A0A1H9WRG6_9BACI|nr:hypothetical protein [Salipaludibacillus aurantiacus]SES36401.1 hypothetical protein SAMN05518684_11936 [Salipaludibacillus aurantiacus]